MYQFTIEEYISLLQAMKAGLQCAKEVGTDYQIGQIKENLLMLNEHWPVYEKPLAGFAAQCAEMGAE